MNPPIPGSMSKALLVQKLKAKGFVIKPNHWARLDKLIKRGNGYITASAVEHEVRSWRPKWNDALIAELRKALK